MASTIFGSQFDIPGWHEYLYDPTLANVICDRIIHNSHIITIKGDMSGEGKNLGNLILHAKMQGVEKEVRAFTEVML